MIGFLKRLLKPAPKPLDPEAREEIADRVRKRWELDHKVEHLNRLADEALAARTRHHV